MIRLARPLSHIEPHYDVVVVGSGYAGGVAACRLSRAGRSVCLLERGKELHPGEYPSRLYHAPRHLQATTTHGSAGSPTALFDVRLGKDLSVVVGCGLGGTSLINANVALRPPPAVFEDDRWPAELREGGLRVLAPYFDRAEEMLGVNPYPGDYPVLPKLKALERTAEALGATVTRPPLAVTFADSTNAAGVRQQACRLCGDCVTGCNYNAKNTVLMNYLPDAARHGAQIFVEAGVRTVRRVKEQWLVEFRDLSPGARRFKGAPTRFVTADIIILAAGTLGSTEILLRSRDAGLPLSQRLGHSFTGNGDVLAFAYDGRDTVRAVGLGARAVVADNAVGPCITGMIEVPDPDDPTDGLLVQDGSIPGLTASLAGPALGAVAAAFGSTGSMRPGGVAGRLLRMARSFTGPRRGPVDRSLPYLVMSSDDDNGDLVLSNDRLRIDWPNVGRRPVFVRNNAVIAKAAEALGATYVPSPSWTTPFGKSLLTVHPLGGADMGDDASTGVVNHKGQVFAGPKGRKTHDGFYVADGAAIPRPLGSNPALTITAVAERLCDLLVQDRGWPGTTAGAPSVPRASKPGLRFTERMAGHFTTAVTRTYRQGSILGRSRGTAIEFVLTIDYDDIDLLLADQSVQARVSGTVTAPALSPHRLIVTGGSFRLLVPNPDHVETFHMLYELDLRTEDGRAFGLRGFKLIQERGTLDAWPDATTLYVQLLDDHGNNIGTGLMRIGLADFWRQFRATLVTNEPDPGGRKRHLFAFRKMFAGRMLSLYGGPLDHAGDFPSTEVTEHDPITGARELRLPDHEVWWCNEHGDWIEGEQAGPGGWLQLRRYRGGGKGPVMMAAGFAMSATSYLADTTSCNLVEYLVAREYDVWLFDYRAGIQLPSATRPFVLDDVARDDWPAAVSRVRQETGSDSVQVIAHCVGALTFQMAMLAGMTGVRSAVCSQVSTHLQPSLMMCAKAALPVEGILDTLGVRRLPSIRRRTLPHQLLDPLLRMIPTPPGERCGQALCRWLNATYGCTHRHAQLNDPTHTALHRMFGVGDITALKQFALSLKKGHLVDARGRDVYLKHPERLAIPLLYVHGERNYMFLPEGSARTVQWLSEHNGPGLYKRLVLEDYAHLDTFLGRDSATEVFGHLVDHLEETAFGA